MIDGGGCYGELAGTVAQKESLLAAIVGAEVDRVGVEGQHIDIAIAIDVAGHCPGIVVDVSHGNDAILLGVARGALGHYAVALEQAAPDRASSDEEVEHSVIVEVCGCAGKIALAKVLELYGL